jgi:hypothetical protein
VTGIKKIKLKFIKNVLIASFIVFLICVYPLSRYASGSQIISIISGYIISLINVILGYIMIQMALTKGTKSFMVIIFGGMLIRMMIVFIFLILLITYSNFDTTSLITSVFFFYFLFMGLEIYYLVKKKPEDKLKLNVLTKQ